MSRTLRAIGPSTDSALDPSVIGYMERGPARVLKPTTLQKLAGFRSDPPKSLPSARGTIPQASATAAPPLLTTT